MAGQYSAIGSQAIVRVEHEESYAIVMGFPTADPYVYLGTPAFQQGQVVKLNNDGTVSLVAASTDVPFGVVASGWERDDSPNIRVYTPFVVTYNNCTASGTVNDGDKVACTGIDANGNPIFKTAVTGDYVCGICLVGGATGTSIKVGFLRVPSLVAHA